MLSVRLPRPPLKSFSQSQLLRCWSRIVWINRGVRVNGSRTVNIRCGGFDNVDIRSWYRIMNIKNEFFCWTACWRQCRVVQSRRWIVGVRFEWCIGGIVAHRGRIVSVFHKRRIGGIVQGGGRVVRVHFFGWREGGGRGIRWDSAGHTSGRVGEHPILGRRGRRSVITLTDKQGDHEKGKKLLG